MVNDSKGRFQEHESVLQGLPTPFMLGEHPIGVEKVLPELGGELRRLRRAVMVSVLVMQTGEELWARTPRAEYHPTEGRAR
jgi:hypothetical protein